MSENCFCDPQGRPLVVTRPEGEFVMKDSYKPDWEPQKGFYWNCTIFGDWVQTREGTSFCCDPSTETYWSM